MSVGRQGRRWLVFNGDADGICAAHQLRLAGFVPDQLLTGVKRDIDLLERVSAAPGDHVAVADISLDVNRAPLMRLLAGGVSVVWYDHHHAGAIPMSPALEAHVDLRSDTCSSLIVDAVLGGRYRAWAIAAAFGDNLHSVARGLATAAGLAESATLAICELGELINYNAYGETVADLHVAPEALFVQLAPFTDPLAFIAATDLVPRLRQGMADDMARARACQTQAAGPQAALVVLPAVPWSRRVNGVFANELAREHPGRAHAILVRTADGYVVSVRAPLARPHDADTLCRGFATGGGRARAAGINHLPQAEFERFCRAFAGQFSA